MATPTITPADFVRKWAKRFADNEFQNIREADFREFAADIAAVFGMTVANVPAYQPGTPYQAGFLVRYTPPGGQEAFYYSLVAGVLAAPAGNFTEWKVVPGPTTETALSQAITLLEAQGLDQTSVKAGRDYLINFGPDATGATQTITVRGVSNDRFDVEGTLEVGGIVTAVTEVNVQAGTWQVKQYGIGNTSTHSTTQGQRSTGPILLFTRPGTLMRIIVDNVDDNVYQVNYRDSTNQKWVVGAYVGSLAAVNAVLAAVPNYAFGLGVQLRTLTVPLDNTQESNFLLVGAGTGFYKGDTRPFLAEQTGPPLGNVLINSQFTQAMGNGWYSGSGNPTVTMGGGTATFINSISYADCIQNINLQARDYELRIGITRLANNSLLAAEVYGNGFSSKTVLGGLGEQIIAMTIPLIGGYTVSLSGVADGDLNHCYLVPV